MANYVSNSVLFIGNEQAVNSIRELFHDIQEKQSRSHQYHMPDFITGDKGYMEDIDTSQEWLNYETRWVPNLEVLQQIAEHYQVDFIARYEEPMNWLYGEAVFTAGALQQVNLLSYAEESWDDPDYLALQELQAALLSGQQPKPGLSR